MDERFVKKTVSIEEAEEQIKVIRQDIAVMGGNDFEIPSLNDLLKKLKAKLISPEKALKQARDILGAKQNYH